MHAVCLEGYPGRLAGVAGSYCCHCCRVHSRMPCTEHFCTFLWPEIWLQLLLWPPSLGSQPGPRGTLRTSFCPLLRPRRARPEWVTPCHGLCLRAGLALPAHACPCAVSPPPASERWGDERLFPSEASPPPFPDQSGDLPAPSLSSCSPFHLSALAT